MRGVMPTLIGVSAKVGPACRSLIPVGHSGRLQLSCFAALSISRAMPESGCPLGGALLSMIVARDSANARLAVGVGPTTDRGVLLAGLAALVRGAQLLAQTNRLWRELHQLVRADKGQRLFQAEDHGRR